MIDAVSVLAVEQCLVGKLPSLFQAELILDLEDGEITRLAQESAVAASKRVQCKEKLAVLEAGKEDLNRLDSHRSLISGKPMIASTFRCMQADNKLANPVVNNFDGKSDAIFNSLGTDSVAVESASTATQSDNESHKRVLPLEDLREIHETTKNASILSNGLKKPTPATEPEDDFSFTVSSSKKEKKKKKKTSIVWDEE